MWDLVILVTHAAFDAAGWSDEPQPVQSIHNGALIIFKDFKLCSLLKKENLQEYFSVQVDLNRESEEGLILDSRKIQDTTHGLSN